MLVLIGIFKFIAYMILIILALIVTILTLILFVPIRYTVDGDKQDEILFHAKITWLLHIIVLRVIYNNENTDINFRVFGKTIYGKKNKDDYKSEVSTVYEQTDKHTQVKKNDEEYNIHLDKDTKVRNSNIKKVKKTTSKPNKTEEIKRDAIYSKKKNSKSKARKKNKKNKMKNKWLVIYRKVKEILKNEENKQVLSLLKEKLLHSIKHILPRKYKFSLIIGTGDPATTGYIVGVISILYMVLGNKLSITPEFEEKSLKGNFYVKGRIYLIVIMKDFIMIILNKRVRKLIKQFNN